jgi:hypothetical protein
MNFSDEEYVRLYTTDTVTWDMLSWESRALLVLALRKFDRSGVFEFGHHDIERSLSSKTKLPVEIVSTGLRALFSEEIWILEEGRIFWPKYIEAQTCKRSDRIRQRMSRAARGPSSECDNRDAVSHGVTGCHEQHENVTSVTKCHPRQGKARQGLDPDLKTHSDLGGILRVQVDSKGSSEVAPLPPPPPVKAGQRSRVETANVDALPGQGLAIAPKGTHSEPPTPKPTSAGNVERNRPDPFRSSFTDSPAPDSIEFTTEQIQYASDHGVDIAECWFSCRDDRRAKKLRREDWSAEFWAWLRREVGFRRSKQRKPKQPSAPKGSSFDAEWNAAVNGGPSGRT